MFSITHKQISSYVFALLFVCAFFGVNKAEAAIVLDGTASDNTDNTTSVVVNVSGANIDDDDLILFMGAADGLGYAMPSGFTEIARVDTATDNVAMGYKIASSEPTSYTVNTVSGGERGIAIFAVYSGVDTLNPINATTTSTNNGVSITIGSVTPDNDNSAVVVFVGADSGNNGDPIASSWPSTVTEQLDNVNGPPGAGVASMSGAFGDVIQTTAATVSGAVGWGEASALGSIVAVLNEAGGGGSGSGDFISGTVYQADGVTDVGAGVEVKLAYRPNNGSVSTSTIVSTTTSAGGAYAFDLEAAALAEFSSISTPITVWVAASSTFKATTFTKTIGDVTPVENLNLYQDVVQVESAYTSGSVILFDKSLSYNSGLSHIDSSVDADILYTTATSTLELSINDGATFRVAQGATVTKIASSTFSGDVLIEGQYNHSVFGTTTFAGSDNILVSSSTATSSFGSMAITGDYTLFNPISVNNLTVASGGTLSATGTVEVLGNVSNNGSLSVSTSDLQLALDTVNLRSLVAGTATTTNSPDSVLDTFLSSDGSKLYTYVGGSTDVVNEYALSIPWDVSSASFTHATSVAFTVENMSFSSSGDKMYFVHFNFLGETTFYEYSLDTPWDVSSASFTQSEATSTLSLPLLGGGLAFSNDGTAVHVVLSDSTIEPEIFSYTLSTPWDISTLASLNRYSSSTFGVDLPGAVSDLTFSSDGLSVILVSNDLLTKLTLSTPFDMSTAVYEQELETNTLNIDSLQGLVFIDNTLYFGTVYAQGGFGVSSYYFPSSQTLSGSLVGSNALGSISVQADNPGIEFLSAASTTGTFTAAASTTLTFNAGDGYTFQNIDWQGVSTTSELALRSSAGGSQWALDVPGSQLNLEFVNVQDSDATDTSGGMVAASSTDNGNNVNWSFGEVASPTGVTISGTLYAADGVTPITTGKTIVAAVGTSTPSLHSTTTNGSGSFTISGIATSSGATQWATSSREGVNSLRSVAYGNGTFAAVGLSGTNHVITSSDGITWTGRSAAGDDDFWRAVTYGNGTFVAVGDFGDRVMTSPDGITWTAQDAAGNDDSWYAVTYGNGLFVALGISGDRIMTSPDGINWTVRSGGGGDDDWKGVVYGNDRFVAVAEAGDDRVMTSSDGISWATTTALGDDDSWKDVTYGNGLFVAVAQGLGEDNVMSSPDGVTWTAQTAAGSTGDRLGVTYGNGLFVAVGESGTGRVMTSPDGVTWTAVSVFDDNDSWTDVTYGNGRFVAVAFTGGADEQLMSAPAGFGDSTPITLYVDNETEDATTITYGINEPGTISGIDLYRDTLRLQHSSTSGSINLANADFYDASDDADILFTSTTSTTTINADLIVDTNTTLLAPQHLDLGADFTNNGILAAEGGEFYFATTSMQSLFSFRPIADNKALLDTQPNYSKIFVAPDGDKLYALANSGNIVNEFDLSVAWDMSSAVYSNASTSVPDRHEDLHFSSDGTKMYIAVQEIGVPDDYIAEYALSPAWDVTSASYVDQLDVDISAVTAISFSDDGTELYIVGSNGDLIEQHTLSLAWDVSTAALTSSSTVPEETMRIGFSSFDISDDGATIHAVSLDEYGEYILDTPYDVSTMRVLATSSAAVIGRTIADNHLDSAQNKQYFLDPVLDTVVGTQSYQTLGGNLVGNSASHTLTLGSGSRVVVGNTASTSAITIQSGGELLAPTSTLSVGNSFENSGTFSNNEGTVQFAGDNVLVSGTLTADSRFHALSVVGSTTISSIASTTNLTIGSGGVFTAPTKLSISGSYANNGTFNNNGGEVLTDGIFADLSSARTDGSFGVGSEDLFPFAVSVSGLGDKLYMAGGISNFVYEYAVAIPGDMTSASLAASTSVGVDGISFATDIDFSPAGDKMFVSDTNKIIAYDLSIAWDVSSAVFSASTSAETAQTSITFSPDGTRLYQVDDSEVLRQYDVSTAWDITSLSFVASTSIAAAENAFGVYISPNGTELAVLSYSFGSILQYSLATPWDITSISAVEDLAAYAGASTLAGLSLTADGTRAYVADVPAREIIQLTLGESQRLSGSMVGDNAFNDLTFSGTSNPTFTSPASTTNTFTIASDGPQQVTFNAGDTYTFENVDWLGSSVTEELLLRSSASGTQWALDVPGSQLNLEFVNVQDSDATDTAGGMVAASSTDNGNNVNWSFGGVLAVTASTTSNVSASAATLNGEITSIGGANATTRGFIYSTSSDFSSGVATTSESGAYDIDSYTSSTSVALSVGTQESLPEGMLFNDDGTILYVTGGDGDDINAYPLPTPYDIDSYTSGTSIVLDVSSQEGSPSAMLFNDDGTVLYVLGWGGLEVNAYPLPTPYDIDSYTSGTSIALDVFGDTTSPSGMLFNNDGTIFYVLDWGGADITAYPLPTPYDISSYSLLSGTSIALDVSSQETAPEDMLFNDDGTILYVTGGNGADINAYPLPTPYDIDSYTSGTSIVLDVSSQEADPSAMLFNNDGTILYVLGYDGDDINAYPLAGAYATGTYAQNITGLDPDTTYYVRAFAENSSGIAYSVNTESFTTSPDYTLTTISGTLYQNDGITAITTGKTITAAIGTSTPSLHSVTSDGSGNFSVTGIATSSVGAWATSSAAGDNDQWRDIAYGNGTFVAVANGGTDRVMYSYDGITWATTTAAGNDDQWRAVTYGNGIFVAVGISGDRVMTSPDGITWTARSAVGNDDNWYAITYGNGIFVAVGIFGDRVMTSPDGITWTARSAVGNNDSWYGITYGNGLFVASGDNGDVLMTSPDGITWTSANWLALGSFSWNDLAYGNGVFVGVGSAGGNRVMTSPDGTNWTLHNVAGDNDQWQSVVYVNGLFVAVAGCSLGGDDCVMTSPDGITWTVVSAAGDNDYWAGVAYGKGLLVAVGDECSYTSGESCVMTADAGFGVDTPITLFVDGETEDATTLTYGLNASTTISSIDLYQDTVRLQHSSTSGSINLGNADFYDAEDDTDILFTATTSTTTINADLIVNSNTTLVAPQHLNIDTDLTINGVFAAERGEVLLTGGNQTLITSATTTFHDFTAASTSARTLTFSSGEEYVFSGELILTGVDGELTSLDASTPANEYFFRPNATATVEYLNVQDSYNISATTTPIDCLTGCVDGGNTSGWSLPVTVGSSAISNHDAGQVSDAFNFMNKTNEPFYAFQLTPESGNATVTALTIDISGAQEISVSDFSNIRLFKDLDNDADYDVTDQQVGGAGVMTPNGQAGTITFSADFLATTTTNYLVTADWNYPARGSQLNLTLYPSGVSMIDADGTVTVSGTVDSVQHSRLENRGGGGGSSARLGDDAPAGDGEVSGGGSDGGDDGGRIDTNTGGGLIGSAPDFFWPTANSGSWTDAANAYDQTDGTYATDNTGVNNEFSAFNDPVPGSDAIEGISVKLEISGTTAAGSIGVQLSWDGGTSWTTSKNTPTLTTTDTVVTLGGPSDTWGRSWTASEFSSQNFTLRITGAPSENTVQIDELQVRVYHQATGGGGGGGGRL